MADEVKLPDSLEQIVIALELVGCKKRIEAYGLRRAIAAALLRSGADGWHAALVLLKGTLAKDERQHLDDIYERNDRELHAQADALEGKR